MSTFKRLYSGISLQQTEDKTTTDNVRQNTAIKKNNAPTSEDVGALLQ